MNKVLVILGPTSTSKTDLALNLAKKFNGELISCDSRQVYVGLDIGTGKLPNGKWKIEDGRWKKGRGWWEIDGIKVWMYDVLDPKKQYTVYDFIKGATAAIEEIQKKGKLPIIVGGAGLYLKGLLYGFPNLEIPVDKKIRRNLEKLTREQLQKKLKEISSVRWKKLNSSDRENPRRLVRAIELSLSPSRLPRSLKQVQGPRNDVLKIGLTAPRDILYQRIDERVISRIDQGMVDEAKKLHNEGISLKRMRQLGLEYGILADYLEDKITKDNLIKIMQGKIHAFAKRQVTWFKKEKDINWFNVAERKYAGELEKLITKWYYSSDAS